MSDEPERPASLGAARAAAPGERGQNVFERFFPGPAPQDPRLAKRLEALARLAEQRTERDRPRAKGGGRPEQRDGRPATTAALGAQDLDPLFEAAREQTDLLRALVDADIAIRDDARATAQNSRTFAIASIAIAFLTLVATVVTVVAAIIHTA